MKALLPWIGLLATASTLAQTPPSVGPGEQVAPFFSSVARQQEASLRLFEDLTPEPTVSRPQPTAAAQDSGPAFTLVGTSRFGERYRARLRNADGQVIAVDVTPGQPVAIPGYPGYAIVANDARELQLRHPPGAPCRDAATQGVSCTGANTARLSLATAAAVEVAPEPAANQRRRFRGRNVEGGTEGELTQNPFEVALRNARNLSEEELAELRRRAERFEGRRLDPADLPEGARIMRTPFGDRIVRD